MWIDEKKRPVVRVTGSHKHLCLFGAMDIGGKQLFRQYERFNGDTFLEFLKTIHSGFSKCHLFLDKASPHHMSKRGNQVSRGKQGYSGTGISSYSITRVYGDGGGMDMAKNGLLVSSYYPSFADFKNKIISVFQDKKIQS